MVSVVDTEEDSEVVDLVEVDSVAVADSEVVVLEVDTVLEDLEVVDLVVANEDFEVVDSVVDTKKEDSAVVDLVVVDSAVAALAVDTGVDSTVRVFSV